MDIAAIEALRELNNAFYREHAASFSATRASAWEGWRRCAELIGPYASAGSPSVLDVACGNLRFEEFLSAELPDARIAFHAVDSCEALLPRAAVGGEGKPLRAAVDFRELDVIEAALAAGPDGGALLPAGLPQCDATVCFGFMHHVPSRGLRERIVKGLVRATHPGGVVVVSLWRFMECGSFADKARREHARSLQALREAGSAVSAECLEEGDMLLGWQNAPGAVRYCHSFSDAEVDGLAACVSREAKPVARYLADGKTRDMNAYLALRVL